ncbi:hypothetical protein BJ138DRAFT_1168109 [Hygrophoropsis aurantiaca]|uniref:Uncharacterized protein n=1 Tax=Hygrophoropsis aurantiaca TaxID=72124 RepID=A0ACB7ZRY3_9AGAM|nr:hypothetical protein BJ138DRAFT_1168109 [Hygrophoropsis aurantiaca]
MRVLELYTSILPLFIVVTQVVSRPSIGLPHDSDLRSTGLRNLIGRWRDALDESFTTVPTWGFWENAADSMKDLENYMQDMLHDVTREYPEKIAQFKSTVGHVVTSAGDFRRQIEKHDISLESLSNDLGGALDTVLDGLKREFPAPDQAPGHEQRGILVNITLGRCEDAIISLGLRHGMTEENLRHVLHELTLSVEQLIVVTGDLIELHPHIFESIIISAIIMAVPEELILGRLLSMFGFSPYGPVKGSAAAWMQRRFFGKAVRAGSWFALLQRAGMKGWTRVLRTIWGWLRFGSLLS